jgi:selenocysteine-specific translation elongation factor
VSALKALCTRRGLAFFKISAVTGEGIEELKRAIAARVFAAREAASSGLDAGVARG